MKRTRAIAFALLVPAFVLIGSAQTGTGRIGGTVTSPDGPVAAAPVRATHQSTGRIFSTTSTTAGQFALMDLPPGMYEVSVPELGLATMPFVEKNVNVAAGQTTTLNVTLVKGNHGVIGDDNAYLTIRKKYLNVRGAAPRLADGRPDLSGVWNANVDPNPEAPALLPWANDVWKNRLSTAFRDHPDGFCLPGDPTPTIALFYKFVQTKGLLLLLFEHEPHYRQIFLDGRAHPQQADPTWMGHSVGKWDGDTLVVDTTGFNDKSWLIFATGLPHTEMLHMIERYRRENYGTMTVDVTVDDPKAYTRPWSVTLTHRLMPDDDLIEFICNENEKSSAHFTK